MVDARRINKIQNAVVNPHILSKGIATEVHHGGGRSGFQVDALQGVDAIVDEKGVEFLPSCVIQHFLFPAAVEFHLAVPFAVFVEGEGIALQFIAYCIKNNGLVVGVGKEIEAPPRLRCNAAGKAPCRCRGCCSNIPFLCYSKNNVL